MSNLNLGSIGFSAAGGVTLAYGAYSYCTAKGKKKVANLQREAAMRVMVIGLGLLAVGAALYFAGNSRGIKAAPVQFESNPLGSKEVKAVPDYLKPYVKELEGRAIPIGKEPLTKFPGHLGSFPHPEMYVMKDGTACVTTTRTLPSFEDCKEKAVPLKMYFQISAPEQYQEAQMHSSRWYKGYLLRLPGEGYTDFTFGMDPQIAKCHANGLKTAEKLFLQDSQLATRTDQEIVNSMQKVHRAMTEKLLHPTPAATIKPGMFRSEDMLVFDDKTDKSAEAFKGYLRSHGIGTKADFANVDSWFKKLKTVKDFAKMKPLQTAEELKTIKKIVFMPPGPEEVPGRMVDFAKKFKEIFSLVKKDPAQAVSAAAWTHQECGAIHPFNDANGRECRSLANTVLEWGGIKGVIFPNDKEYTAAVRSDEKQVGTFAGYLLDIINWNRKQKVLNA